jgi:hypothetical protein
MELLKAVVYLLQLVIKTREKEDRNKKRKERKRMVGRRKSMRERRN